MRSAFTTYPDYTAEIKDIRQNGLSLTTLSRIIRKHAGNASRTRRLYDRYQTLDYAVPIYNRRPAFDDNADQINHKIMNDFFSEIIDVKVGYFAGNPFSYGYAETKESREDTGGAAAVEAAGKAVTDFTTLNNMHDIDIETTKVAAICGYCGRLFYIDEEGQERVFVTMPFETIVLADNGMTEPAFAIRYLQLYDLNDSPYYRVDFYDEKEIITFEGLDIDNLKVIDHRPHFFDYCPLQGVPNNLELMGDTERVEEAIDAYDRALSDASNELEAFANAYMVFENVDISEEARKNAQKTGCIRFFNGGGGGRVYFLTKEIKDTFTENHLDRLEDNIYRFSKTPNLTGDQSFGSASGVSLRFKVTGLETKCGIFEAKLKSANQYMFKLLASSWAKKRLFIDPLQCVAELDKRNFPLDLASEAQSCATLIGCGFPKKLAFSQLSFVDDPSYVMELIKEEEDGIPDLELDDQEEAEQLELPKQADKIEENDEEDKPGLL